MLEGVATISSGITKSISLFNTFRKVTYQALEYVDSKRASVTGIAHLAIILGGGAAVTISKTLPQPIRFHIPFINAHATKLISFGAPR